MPKMASMKCPCLVITPTWQQLMILLLLLLFKATKEGFCHTTGLQTHKKSWVTKAAPIQLAQRTHWAFATKQMDLCCYFAGLKGSVGLVQHWKWWMTSLSRPLHGNRIHKTTAEPGRRNLVPSVSPWAQATCLIQPLLLWCGALHTLGLHPKHSGTLPDAAEGWQIVELITVWQVLFKCCSLPTALPRQ